MGSRRLSRYLAQVLLLLGLAPGCQALHRYQPVEVLARDAETGRPLPAADVRLSYPMTSPAYAPWESTGTTAADGVARLRAAPSGDAGVLVAVDARGYMPAEKNLSVEAVRDQPGQAPTRLVVELYAEPHPTVELIVPDGYRGLIKAQLVIQEDTPRGPGQRTFSFPVPDSGVVVVTGPPLLRRVFSPDFTARYANGALIPRKPELLETGFWPLRGDADCQVFVVGTRSEFDDYRRFEEREEAGQPQPGRPRAGGRKQHRGGANEGNP